MTARSALPCWSISAILQRCTRPCEAVVAAVRACVKKGGPLTCRQACELNPGLYEAILKHLGGAK